MSLNKEAEALGTTTSAPSQTSPPTYSSPPSGGAPIQPTFTGNAQPQFAQNMQFSPTTQMAQLPPMQNQFVGSNYPTMTQARAVPVGANPTLQPGMGAPLQPGMGVPMQPGLGSPQYAQQTVNVNGFGQQTGSGFAPNVPQGVQVGQFGQAVNQNPGQQQATYVPYPVLVQPQPPAAPSAAQIGERYMAQQYANCAMGNHEWRKKYGMVGIICAIVFFPIGLICMFMDQEETCARCGKRL